MSLNFSGVSNYTEVTTDPNDSERWHPVADALVWLSMICGYGSITSKNVETVTKRIMAYQAVTAAYRSFHKEPVYITHEDIRRFIGMTTNASTMTDAQWLKRLGAIAQREGDALRHRLHHAQTPTAMSEIQRLHDDAQASSTSVNAG